ncbi:MAG: precorrin-8X methylmutase [Desulfomonile tiedjei]|uniref:Precorrin-8X methylmutase n=1 Tax=Desulfomonile tiedjei TaxID=2358 RepID=A0A9D6Z623_9BACT|nr:precorrin-8X methylmutase [Desulfomonile tiedjei]
MNGTRAFIHELLEKPMSGEAIEQRSFDIIDKEACCNGFTVEQWPIVRRILHTTADFGIAGDVRFSGDAIHAGTSALRSGSRIFVDSNMIRSGLSIARLRQVQPEYEQGHVVCHVADEDVAQKARETGLPRSLFAVQKAREVFDGGIAVFGNAPVALLELNRLIMEEGIKPALVVAMPVGFVHVTESKEELMSLQVPFIAIAGRRGGSPLAVATIHALCSLVVQSGSQLNGE